MVAPIERTPPASIEAEMGLLGSLLLDPETIHDVRGGLFAEDFYRDPHALIYRAILAVLDSGRPLNLVSIVEELHRSGKYDAIGGHDYLVEVAESIPHAAHARYYADLIRQKAIARAVINSAEEIIRRAYSNDYSAQELVEFAERTIFAVGDRREGYKVTTIGQAVIDAMARLDDRLNGHRPGQPTGLSGYDALTGGLHPGQLVVVAARPAMGKTALALNIADHVATDCSVPTLFASLEMTEGEIGDRAVCGRAEIDGGRFADPRANLTDADFARMAAAVERFRASPLWIGDAPAQSLGEVVAQARRFRARERIGLLVIDYLQLLEPGESAGRVPRHEQVAMMTRTLKQLAKGLKIPVILLCQLNREVEKREDRRPRMSDLRESGAIEQDADVVSLLHRPEYYDPNDKPGVAELIVAKNRGGSTGTVPLLFHKAQTKFTDLNAIDPAIF